MSKQNKAKGKPKINPIACPESEVAVIEGLIDLLIIKGVFKDEELRPLIDTYGSVMNALIDLLIIKGVFKDYELDVATSEFHRFVQALGSNNFMPPAVLFERRRNAIRERLAFEEKIRAPKE